MKLNHVMIDLETMGLTPNSAIVSIGAVVFDPRANKVSRKTFYRELEWDTQNRKIDAGTLNWWYSANVTDQAREALDGLEDLEPVLGELADWLPKDAKVWGNGATFDISMLEDAYNQHDIEIPWKFWNIRDVRTIKDMYESQRGGFSKKSGGVAHNALDDALHQAQYTCMMWNKLIGE